MTSEESSGVSVRHIQEALRDLVAGLGRLNQAVGQQVALRPGDLEVLDVVARRGPVSPGRLAESLSIHPATLTGVLDRLVEGGWAERRPDPSDRRRVLIHALRKRGGELRRHYAPMARAVGEICADYSPAELAAVLDFLRRTAVAGRHAVVTPTSGHSDAGTPRSRTRPVRRTTRPGGDPPPVREA